MNPTAPNVSSYAFRSMFDRLLSASPEFRAKVSALALVLEQRRRFAQDLRAAKTATSPSKTHRHRRTRKKG
jgi:hypothetical protein